ncbi:MAG TPA: hypothetical protein EYP60_04870 [bacterium (Candidatus Stahlbacteria)]|nr:hypothetical protein [Candidatus Stahlbacteria bacterium]
MKNIKKEVRNADLIVFDMVKSNDGTGEDRNLLKIFGAPVKSDNVFGVVGDNIKRKFGKTVIGASEWTEKLELDRKIGSQYAKKIGISIPMTHEFNTLNAGINFLSKNKGKWVFKPNNNKDLDLTYVESYEGELLRKMKNEYPNRIGNKINYILQEKIEGDEISTEGLFNGKEFTSFNHTLELKKLMTGNVGLSIGSQSNIVWVKKDYKGLLVDNLRRMEKDLRKAKYIGPIDFNCIVRNGIPYFIEISARTGFDALYNTLNLIKGPISNFFFNKFNVKFKDGFSASERISIPPYPYATPQLLNTFARDVSVNIMHSNFWMEDVYFNNGIKCAGSDGILGVETGYGKTFHDAWRVVHRNINKLKISAPIQYRMDGFSQTIGRFNNLYGHIQIL